MKILNRLARICKADIHGLMDQIENKDLLLKQYLRDMAAALAQRETRQKKMRQSRQAASQKLLNTNREIEKLEQDLEVALKHSQDTIARHLIRRLKPIQDLRSAIQHHVDKRDREMAQVQASIDQQRLQFEQLKLRAANFINRSEQTELYTTLPDFISAHFSQELSHADVERELRRRKQTIFENQGGSPA